MGFDIHSTDRFAATIGEFQYDPDFI